MGVGKKKTPKKPLGEAEKKTGQLPEIQSAFCWGGGEGGAVGHKTGFRRGKTNPAFFFVKTKEGGKAHEVKKGRKKEEERKTLNQQVRSGPGGAVANIELQQISNRRGSKEPGEGKRQIKGRKTGKCPCGV